MRFWRCDAPYARSSSFAIHASASLLSGLSNL
jgi:hypothetical protein